VGGNQQVEELAKLNADSRGGGEGEKGEGEGEGGRSVSEGGR
jgi:hypothetical protein